jgi:hypothetical protein
MSLTAKLVALGPVLLALAAVVWKVLLDADRGLCPRSGEYQARDGAPARPQRRPRR